ncbi:MAG: serine hydrolase [Vulcanimicrobiaceae bacterium]
MLVFLFAANAVGAALAVPDDATAGLQADLDLRTKALPGTGIILAVVDHGKTAVFKSGSSGTSRQLDEHTLFEIGSVTKTFTATLLSQFVLNGKVALKDPVAAYLPKTVRVPSHGGKAITLLDLATQHSGLPRLPSNMDGASAQDPYAKYTKADLYAFLGSYKLTRDPGAEFEYSNYGVGLLGQALANKAGIPYDVLLERDVLRPLRMDETSIKLTPELQSRFAAGHDSDGDPAPSWNFDALAPAGAIRSTLADMLKYLRCNMGQGPLAKYCLYAQRPQASMPGGRIGLIWWTGARGVVDHGGDTAGYHAMVAVSADHQRGVVVLSNAQPVEDIGLHALDPRNLLIQFETAQMLESPAAQEYAGDYVFSQAGRSATLSVGVQSGKLMAQITGQQSVRIFPAGHDRFLYHVVDAELDFQRNPAGKIVAVNLYQDGRAVQWIRKGVMEKIAPTPPKPYPPVVAQDVQTLQSYVGTYAASPDVSFTVTLAGEQLMVRLTGQDAYPVYPWAKDRFYYKIVNADIVFMRDGTGKVNGLIKHQLGTIVNAVKQ